MSLNQLFRPLITSLFAALLALVSFDMGISAQESTPDFADSPRTITVRGTGVVSVTPDTATVTLGVTSSDESLEVAQDDVTSDLENVTAGLKEAGIADDDLATSQYSVSPINEYDDNRNFKGVQGYEVSAALNVTVRDLATLGEILDTATDAGANQIWGISMYVDDPADASNQAREAAMSDARDRAETLARSEGLLITGAYRIDELSAPQPKAVDMDTSGNAVRAAEEDAASSVPISTGTTNVQVEVQVIYITEQGNG